MQRYNYSLEERKISIDIEKRNILKYLLFADLYFPEGVSNILVPILTPIFLNSLDIPLGLITVVVGIGWSPWIIKFLWSGVIDRYISKGRKIFVILGGLIAVFCLIILFFIGPDKFLVPFTIVLFLSQVGQTLLDSAADAWGIEVSTNENRGRLNGAMNIGMVLGTGIGAIILTFFSEAFGHNYMFLIAGTIIFINLIVPALIKETKKHVKKQKALNLLLKEFRKDYVKLLLIYMLLASVGGGIFTFGLPLYASDVLDFSTGLIGLIAGFGTVFAIPGSIAGGIISDKKGRKKAIYFFTIPTVFFILLLFIFSTNFIFLIILYVIIIFLFSGFTASIFAICMDATNSKIGGSQFSLYNCFSNIGYISSGTITGSIIVTLGYNSIFILSGLLLLPPLIVLHFIRIVNNK